MAVFKGVHHAGMGVSDMERSLRFYRETLGFSEVEFDYTGSLPGLERLTGRPETIARVVFLANPKSGPLGMGRIKLVKLELPESPQGIPDGFRWGELGLSEICINCHCASAVLEELEHKGCHPIIPLQRGPVAPYGLEAAYWYIADPDGAKVELIDWAEMCPMLPGPRIEGLNHVAFGVTSMQTTLAFYERLGFTSLIDEYKGILKSMSAWFDSPIEQHLVIKNCYPGAGIEPVAHTDDFRDCRGAWGHLGPFEFGIEVSNIEMACEFFIENDVELLSDVQAVNVGSKEWKYVYFAEPDGLFVSAIEARF